MNDPNGLIQWKGQYHLFYQHNPNGPFHGTIHWGHAVSNDLVHWKDLPIGLCPTPGGPDREGCYSGCAIDHDGTPTLVYTGISPQTVCLATSSDDLLTWEKHPSNPVITEPPAGVKEHAGGNFRDPYLWKEDGCWYMVIGSKIEGQGGLVLLYRSQDLIEWEYLGVLIAGDVRRTKPLWTGTMWECPNYLKMGGKDVLIISAQATSDELMYPFYYVGSIQDHQFVPEVERRLVHGNCFYAPQVMRTDDERWVMFGWLKSGRRATASLEAGWSGVMSLPIRLSLLPDGRLGMEPVEELKSLRQTHWQYRNEKDLGAFLGPIQSAQLEIVAEIDPSSDAEFGFKVRSSPDDEEETLVAYNASSSRLLIDKTQSSLSTAVHRDMQKATLSLGEGESLRLHIFVDHSTLEVFANGHICMASRLYPTRDDSVGLDFVLRNGSVEITSLDVWEMDSIWEARENSTAE